MSLRSYEKRRPTHGDEEEADLARLLPLMAASRRTGFPRGVSPLTGAPFWANDTPVSARLVLAVTITEKKPRALPILTFHVPGLGALIVTRRTAANA